MKKIFIALAAVAAFVGCSKENMPNDVVAKNNIKMNASIDVDATRVSVEGEKFTDVKWEEDDKVTLVSDAGTNVVLAAVEGGDKARFEGEGELQADVDTYYAIYPNVAIAEGVATIGLGEQKGDDAAVLVAKAENMSKDALAMTFTPANALLHVAVSGVSELAKAEFKAFNGAAIASEFVYNFTDDSASAQGETAAYVVENPSTDGFFFALPADMDMAEGYVVSLTDAAGNVCSKAYNGKTFARGTTTRVEIEWSVPSVTLGAKTSYSYYLLGDSASANNCANNVIYFTGDCASSYSGIQNAFISEVGFVVEGTTYSSADGKVTWDKSAKSFSMSNMTVSEWRGYSAKAYIKTTDGETITLSNTLYITGLPYHADWRSADYSDWKYTNISDKGEMLQVDGASGWNTSKLGCIITPVFNIPSGSISVSSAIAASTNATSVGGYTTSYAYVGTQSSSAKESGASATIGYTSDFEGKMPDTPLVMHSSALSLSGSNPCVVMTAKDFRVACNTYIFQAKITYAE